MSDALSKFGEILMNEVRDRTICVYDKRVHGEMKDASSQRFYKEVGKLNDPQRQILEKMIPQVVDLCLHNIMCMLEDHRDLELRVNGENLSDISDGLAGELYTEDGWIQKYSKERYETIY